ncbi:MAG TPA: hypothetical protein VFB14_28335 [Bryobacteraceae bacterium]|jgi:hypothetical protein|nr:hypothetical protein [Bryobacteraceae bacterium]
MNHLAMWRTLQRAVPNFSSASFSVLSTLLNELSDQNAYQRYLKMNGVTHSSAEWRKFIDGRYHRKYHQAKCC